MANLVTSARAKMAIAQGSFSTQENSLIDTLCIVVSVAARRYLGREPELSNHEEILDGTGGEALLLRNYPVVSVTRVSLRDNSLELGGYTIDHPRGILWRTNGLWTGGRRHYRVLYSGGFSPLPDDMVEACAQWVAGLYWQGKDSPARAFKGPPPSVESLLYPFKKPIL